MLRGNRLNGEGCKSRWTQKGPVHYVIQGVINDVAETETQGMAHGSHDSEQRRQYRSV